MSMLTVELGKEGGAAYGAPIPAEIFDADAQVVERTILRVGTPNLIELKPGRYLVRAQLPSGRSVQSAAKLTPKRNARVDLGPLDSPAEALQQHVLLGAVPDTTQPPGPPLATYPGLWLVLWERQESYGWREVPWPSPPQFFDAYRASYWLPPAAERLRMVQVGGTGVPWRLACIPPSDRPPSLAVGTTTPEDGAVTLSVSTGDQDADVLARYLHSGDMAAAEVAGGEVQMALASGRGSIKTAQDFARDKRLNPGRAAIGFYHLLRVHAEAELGDWPSNFVNFFPGLPDTHVIRGWQALRSGDITLARQEFLDAAAAGVPAITDGLRFLNEVLQTMLQEEPSPTLEDEPWPMHGEEQWPMLWGEPWPGVAAAAARMAAYAGAADLTQPLTTFTGTDPDTPLLLPPTGAALGLLDVHRVGAQSPAVPAPAPGPPLREAKPPQRLARPHEVGYFRAALAAAESVKRVRVVDDSGRLEAAATGTMISAEVLVTVTALVPDVAAARRASVEGVALDPDRLFIVDDALGFAVAAVQQPLPAFVALAEAGYQQGAPAAIVGFTLDGRQLLSHESARLDDADGPLGWLLDLPARLVPGSGIFDETWRLVALHRGNEPSASSTFVGQAVTAREIAAALRRRASSAEGWALVGQALLPETARSDTEQPDAEQADAEQAVKPPPVEGPSPTLTVQVPLEITIKASPPPPPRQ
jgi:hypothetical protein